MGRQPLLEVGLAPPEARIASRTLLGPTVRLGVAQGSLHLLPAQGIELGPAAMGLPMADLIANFLAPRYSQTFQMSLQTSAWALLDEVHQALPLCIPCTMASWQATAWMGGRACWSNW